MWIPLAAAWLLSASPEEVAHYRELVGPPKPSGWRVLSHPDNERREMAEREAEHRRAQDARIAALEQAIKDIASWIRAAEGVSLGYYHDLSCSQDEESLRIINQILGIAEKRPDTWHDPNH